MSHPLALDASASDRRALRFKCFTFYGKWEPLKSIEDVNDLCEWALEHGIEPFNSKLKAKYGEDLSSISVNSYLDLPLLVQLKLFYSEYDTKKPGKDIEDVANWALQRPDGIADINGRMNKKYGENLNTFAFGGRMHMRNLLDAYFKTVDPKKATSEVIQATIEYCVANGALALINQLFERYKVKLHISIAEIHGKTLNVEGILNQQQQQQGGDAPRPAIMSLMRGGNNNQISTTPPPPTVRPLSVAFSTASQNNNNNKVVNWSVSEDAEIRGLMEVFYAKNNPEKLSDGGVDALMKYARVNGLESVNVKLQDKYGEDLDTLKVQYTSLMKTLVAYYAKADPNKKNIEDIAAWAIVHGTQPLSDRLEKRYGRGLFEEEESHMDPDTLRSRLIQFYQTFDKQPKSEQDIETILNWVLAGSVSQLNKKLKEKYNANLDDLPPLEVGESVILPTTLPETLGGNKTTTTTTKMNNNNIIKKTTPTPPPSQQKSSPVSKTKKVENRERNNSFASDAGETSMDQMENQMSNMRRITSGQYENLGKQLRAFYRRHDPDKLQNQEALDLVMKWTFKHGMKALNNKFQTHYGQNLESIVLDDQDEEAEEGDDYVPDW